MRNDPDIMLEMFRVEFEDTSNPYYAWQALDVWLKHPQMHQRRIPDWLAAYLTQCVERMKANKTAGLREVLPRVFGFSKKSGPGNLLDPDHDDGTRLSLALKFAMEIEHGEEPSAALTNACNAVLDRRRADKITDKTLRSWLCAHFDLEKWPRTNAEWRSITRRQYGYFCKFIVDRARRISGE